MTTTITIESESYIKIREGRVDNTEDLSGGMVFADYDEAGELLGIEIIVPCTVKYERQG